MAVERKRTLLEGEQDDGSIEEHFQTLNGKVRVRWATPDEDFARALDATRSPQETDDQPDVS